MSVKSGEDHSNICEPRKYEPLERITTEGKVCDAIYVILKGDAFVSKKPPTGEGMINIGALKKGNCFGETGVLLKKARTASVRAVSEIFVFRITGKEIENLEPETMAKFYCQMACDLSERLERTSIKLTE